MNSFEKKPGKNGIPATDSNDIRKNRDKTLFNSNIPEVLTIDSVLTLVFFFIRRHSIPHSIIAEIEYTNTKK